MVKESLEARGTAVVLAVIKTEGDRRQGAPDTSPGKDVWVREIEEQLLDGRIDAAVHSMKDVPPVLPAGLAIVAVPRRVDPRDALVTRGGGGLADLPRGAAVGTSSVRRRALLLAVRPDLDVRALHGNVDTRVRKLLAREYDAIVLAKAGLERLGAPPASVSPIEPEVLLPAPGQGALAIEARADDLETARAVKSIDDPEAAICTSAERAFSRVIGGSCRTPIAALARYDQEMLELDGLISSLDGSRVLRSTIMGAPDDAEGLGRRLASSLLALGGRDILDELEG